jgi:hypothetical protein
VVKVLEEVVQDATAGDPISGLRWMHKTTRNVADELRRRGICLSHPTVGRLLRELRYSLRTNRKRLARKREPERDRQFRLMERQRRRFFRQGFPVISVDTKKKESVGNFKNPGVCWRKKPREVLDHDFPSDALGRAIPFGIYDEGRNTGYVVVGTSHDTAEFATAALRTWWLRQGRRYYPAATRLLIEADSGGANGNRVWAWKAGIQRLADEIGLTITVAHYPAGASKWNRIEHRMFNLISGNWAGQPLETYETVLNFIRTTKSNTGFRCRARLDTTAYKTKVKVPKEEKAALRISFHNALPQWNYTIRPHSK